MKGSSTSNHHARTGQTEGEQRLGVLDHGIVWVALGVHATAESHGTDDVHCKAAHVPATDGLVVSSLVFEAQARGIDSQHSRYKILPHIDHWDSLLANINGDG